MWSKVESGIFGLQKLILFYSFLPFLIYTIYSIIIIFLTNITSTGAVSQTDNNQNRTDQRSLTSVKNVAFTEFGENEKVEICKEKRYQTRRPPHFLNPEHMCQERLQKPRGLKNRNVRRQNQ